MISPVSAFSFSDFFKDLFGSEDSLTGAVVVLCGDGKLEGDEKCDDKNSKNKDGCSSTCQVEEGFTCDNKKLPSKCTKSAVCGNGVVDKSELCDGNTMSCSIAGGYTATKTCNKSCNGWGSCSTSESCGDGTKNGNEFCDDGDSTNTNTCKNDCTAHSAGDGVCADSESCVTDPGACGECNIETEKPAINFNLPSASVANMITVSTLTVNRGTQCFISISKESYTETQTRRGRESGAIMLTKERISCGNAKADAQSKLQTLPNGEYKVTISALNNIGQAYAVDDLRIAGAAVSVSGLDPSKFYSNLDVPKVSVSSTNTGSCSWKVNDGSSTSYTCSNGLSDLDLSDSSKNGANTFYATIAVSGTDLTYSSSYMYVEDDDFIGETVKSSFGGGGPGDNEGASFVVGDLGNKNFIEPSAGKSALTAIMLNLRRHGQASLSERNEMLDLLKNNNVLKKEITSISQATGLGELSFGVVRKAALTDIKASQGYAAKIEIYTSEKQSDSWSSGSKKEKQFEFTKVIDGETQKMRIDIK